MRRFIGILGLVFVALGFYALALAVNGTLAGEAFRFLSVADLSTHLFGAGHVPGWMASIAALPAFFFYCLLGIPIAAWGLKKRKRRRFKK